MRQISSLFETLSVNWERAKDAASAVQRKLGRPMRQHRQEPSLPGRA